MTNSNIFENCSPQFAYFFVRWNDEKEYEDFAEYIDATKAVIEKNGATFLKMTKRPFEIFYKENGSKFSIRFNRRNATLYVHSTH